MVITRLYIIFAWYYIRSIEFRLNLQLAMMVLNLHFWWHWFVSKIPDVVDVMLETKPWRLAYSFRATDVEDFDFDDLQVTPSLDQALRYPIGNGFPDTLDRRVVYQSKGRGGKANTDSTYAGNLRQCLAGRCVAWGVSWYHC